MQNALFVEGVQSETRLQEEAQNLGLGHGSAGLNFGAQQALQIAILTKLHDDVDFGARDEGVDVVDGEGNVGQLSVNIDLDERL